MKLITYINEHTMRGACTCGRCFDAPANPEKHQPSGHTADLVFFKVSANPNAKAEELRALVAAHVGDYGPCDLFDGKEHSYLEVGGFVGDQGLALMLMGLGSILGLWRLLTPYTVLGESCPAEMAMQMAAIGMVSVQHKPA